MDIQNPTAAQGRPNPSSRKPVLELRPDRTIISLFETSATRERGLEPDADKQRHIGFLLLPDFPLMSYASAVEPLRAANTLAGKPLYRWSHLSVDGRPARASVGLEIAPDLNWTDATRLDQLLVCAGGNPAAKPCSVI